MNRIALAGIVVAGFVVGGGAGWWLFLAPPLKTQEERTRQRASEQGIQRDLEAKLARLQAARDSQGLARIAYFDLRRSANPSREMDAKTVETLAGLTTIFQDQHLEVQALTPAGETLALNKPVPTPAPTTVPGASPAPASTPKPGPAASPTPEPVRLTHKVFRVTLRGEYGDLVRALSEIQALPRAISVNQYTVKLVQEPGVGGATPPPLLASPSLLELGFQLTISFVTAEAAPVAPKQSSLRRMVAWTWSWLEQPAEAAPLARGPGLAPTDEGTRHSGADLVAPRAARTPPPHVPGGHHHRVSPRRTTARKPQVRRSPAPAVVPSTPPASATLTTGAPPSEPTLMKPFAGSYTFPIQRPATTGRANPFKPLGALAAPPGVAPPVLPVPPFPVVAPGQVSAPSATSFELLATMAGGPAPMALLRVDGRTFTVGINELVVGKARVRAIGPDRVTLRVDGQELTVFLRR